MATAPAPKRDWTDKIDKIVIVVVAIFVGLGGMARLHAMELRLDELNTKVGSLGKIERQIEDLAQARNDIIRAIHRAQHSGQR
jgi:hypothetical protein